MLTEWAELSSTQRKGTMIWRLSKHFWAQRVSKIRPIDVPYSDARMPQVERRPVPGLQAFFCSNAWNALNYSIDGPTGLSCGSQSIARKAPAML